MVLLTDRLDAVLVGHKVLDMIDEAYKTLVSEDRDSNISVVYTELADTVRRLRGAWELVELDGSTPDDSEFAANLDDGFDAVLVDPRELSMLR